MESVIEEPPKLEQSPARACYCQSMPAAWLKIRSTLRRSLLAQDCVLCGAASGDALLCSGCADDLPRLHDACPRCAGPSVGCEVCGACLADAPSFDATVAVWRYEFPLDRLVHALKYRGRLPLAAPF